MHVVRSYSLEMDRLVKMQNLVENRKYKTVNSIVRQAIDDFLAKIEPQKQKFEHTED